MEPFLRKLLDYYHLSTDDYVLLSSRVSKNNLIEASIVKGMHEATDRIFKAIKSGEKILIYGDYDSDGICATSILVKTFEKLNYKVGYYIPSRYIDGYGLNVSNVEKIAKSGYNLIITVDNGISANEAIDRANELGIDVIVVDHHEVPSELPKAYAIIHPIVSNISNVIGSGGYMSLFLSCGLLGEYDDYLITLAALSTISDLMELKDYNRVVVKLGLEAFEKNRYLALNLLTDNKIITEKTFGLEIAPKINSIGRMNEDTSVNRLVKYLTSNNKEEIYALHEWIKEVNNLRKEETKNSSDNLVVNENEKGICILTNLKEGLIGLVANRLLTNYNVPSIVFTIDSKDPNLLKGSIRSKEGFNVTKAFESLNKYLLSGGGHAAAGGLSIKKGDFKSFKKDFIELCSTYPITEEEIMPIDIDIYEVSFKNYELLRSLAPFGMGFKEPTFKINNLPTRGLRFISFGKHLSTDLSINSKILGFNMNEIEIKKHSYINIEGNFFISEYRGSNTLEFRVNKWE